MWVFLFLPAVHALYLGFFRVAPFTGRGVYVGLANFRDLFAADDYHHSLGVSLLFVGAVVASGLAVSLGMAGLANQRRPGIGLFRTALLWPYALSPAVAGITNSPGMRVIQVGIKLLVTTDARAEWNLILAGVVLAMVPPLAVVMALQRQCVRSVSMGQER